MLIAHVGDLFISGTDAFTSYISERLEMSTAGKVLRKTNRSSCIIDRGNICDGTRNFTDATLSSNDYEGGVHDISTLPGSAKQTNEPLTESDQFKLRPELWVINVGCGNFEAVRVLRRLGVCANFRND